MNWIFIGMLLGSVVTSSHDTKEACEGRRVMLIEKGVMGQCILNISSINSGTINVGPSWAK